MRGMPPLCDKTSAAGGFRLDNGPAGLGDTSVMAWDSLGGAETRHGRSAPPSNRLRKRHQQRANGSGEEQKKVHHGCTVRRTGWWEMERQEKRRVLPLVPGKIHYIRHSKVK